ncbi:hypothetical protein GQ44DRAFT_274220 [Phaeosphaeriaceae sp. PMI808]|nr:hypothetical protein GQ44DRAFT_274220 [Phaeosphaeriaceae sp. PMI808]
MRQGLSVREWYADMLVSIDLRRFVKFGVIKGFMYRVHRYAFRSAGGGKVPRGNVLEDGSLPNYGPSLSRPDTKTKQGGVQEEKNRTRSKQKQDSDRRPHHRDKNGDGDGDDDDVHLNSDDSHEAETQREKLLGFLDGSHCFDEICTELEISETALTAMLKSSEFGKAAIVCR